MIKTLFEERCMVDSVDVVLDLPRECMHAFQHDLAREIYTYIYII